MNPPYRIGIEMEFLLKPLNMSFGSMARLRNVAEYIVSHCNEELDSKTQIRNKVDKQCRRPEYWSLKKDNSVISDSWNTCIFTELRVIVPPSY